MSKEKDEVVSTTDMQVVSTVSAPNNPSAHFKCPCCQAALVIPMEYYENDRRLTLKGVEKDV
jgi:hypothetical protein